jgi:hypothetical protein
VKAAYASHHHVARRWWRAFTGTLAIQFAQPSRRAGDGKGQTIAIGAPIRPTLSGTAH